MRRTTPLERPRWAPLACAVLSLVTARPAAGQASTGIAADRFVPGVGPAVLLAAEGADTTPRAQVSTAVSLGYLRDPIKLSERFTGALHSEPVRGQLVTDLGAELGVGRGIAVAVGLPVVAWNDGDRLRGTGVDEARLASAAGDLRLRAKAALVGQPTRPGLHAAALLQITVPMGGQAHFAATGTATAEPRLVLDYRYGRLAVAAMIGARFAGQRALFGTSFGDELTWAGGAIVRLFSRATTHVSALAEAAGAAGGTAGTRPVEVRAAMRVQRPGWSLDVGAGAGVDGDVDAPSYRVVAVWRTRLSSAP
jgi:hypothetical protein